MEVPVEWSRELDQMLKDKQKDITYYESPGQGHVLGASENLMLQRTKEFFESNLNN